MPAGGYLSNGPRRDARNHTRGANILQTARKLGEASTAESSRRNRSSCLHRLVNCRWTRISPSASAEAKGPRFPPADRHRRAGQRRRSVPAPKPAAVSVDDPLGSVENFAVKFRILLIGNLAAAVTLAPIAVGKHKNVQSDERQAGYLSKSPSYRRFAEHGNFFLKEMCPSNDETP